MTGGGYIDYLNYALPLWFMSGLIILFVDARRYEHQSMHKEAKVAKAIGWVNLCLTPIVFAVNWVIKTWIWQ